VPEPGRLRLRLFGSTVRAIAPSDSLPPEQEASAPSTSPSRKRKRRARSIRGARDRSNVLESILQPSLRCGSRRDPRITAV
jgi:hypothetical protein